MRSVQNFIIVVIAIFTIVACQKDSDLIDTGSTEIVSAAVEQHNHTHPHKKCASKAYMEEKLLDPIFRANREQRLIAFQKQLRSAASKSRAACSNPKILPVAIHYQGISNPNKNCLVNAAKQAVAVLNADFQAKNSDIIQWDNTASRQYPTINKGAACIRFELATKNHPSGFGVSEGEVAVTINKTNGDRSNQWSGYINIFVGDADGALGYAPLGGQGDGDGMMIARQAFTIGTNCGQVRGQAPNNLGRTLTHEMGHYLNLDHLWGGNGGCNDDDGVADTPNQAEPNYGCPTLGRTRGCSAEALHMNFMDYADDACMYMFSAGQASRVEAWVNSGLAQRLKINVFSGSTNTGNTDSGSDTANNNNNTGNTDSGSDTADNNNNTGNTDTGGNGGNNSDDNNDSNNTDSDSNNTSTAKITIKVTLDDFGSETTFGVVDEYGDFIKYYGPFRDNQAGKVISRNITLPTGFYTFVIEDEYGDGICCDVGRGRWQLLKDNRIIKTSRGRFGYWEEYDFVVGNARLNTDASRIDIPTVSKLDKAE